MTTIGTNPDCPGGIHLLADHLDTALAVGEDLLALVLRPRADLDEADPETAPDAIDQFVHRLGELEAALLMRVLQARRRTGELGRADASLRAAASLFRAQTAVLVELIESVDRLGPRGLGGGNDALAYLRSRGMLAPEAAAPSPYESLVVTEDFRIGGVAALGLLLDLVSSLLDLLDARFGLYAILPDDVAAQDATGDAVSDVSATAMDECASDTGSFCEVASASDAAAGDATPNAPNEHADRVLDVAANLPAGRIPGVAGSEIEQPA